MEKGTRNMLLAAGILAAGVMTSFSASASASAPIKAAAAARPDATVDQVLADSVKAMGGKEAIDKINTMRTVMEMAVPGPQGEMKIEMETLWSRAGGRILRTKLPQGTMEMGTDGKVTWKKGLAGSGTLSPQEAEGMKDRCGMIMNLLEPERAVKEEMTSMESAGKETFDGKECHKLHFISKDGQEGDFFYDVTSHLPVGMQAVQKQGPAEVRETMVLGDWQEVPESGVKVCRTMNGESSAQPGAKMTMKVTKVEINTLKDSDFAPPAGAAKPATPPTTSPAPGTGAGSGGGEGGGTEIKFEDLTPEQQQQAQQMVEKLKSGGDVVKMKQAVGALESALGMISDESKRKPIAYALQEVKKEIAKLGG